MSAPRHHVILGNGITGVSAALRLRELEPDARITMISGESTHHYSRPALMYVFMGHMTYADTKPFEDSFWPDHRIDLVRDWVVAIDTEGRRLELHRGAPISFDTLLLATGSKSNKFGWPGQDLDGVQGLYSLMDLRKLHDNVANAHRAVIVGGGLIGIELAEMLHARGVHVTFLVRERDYWDNVLPTEEAQIVNRLVREAGMELFLETELREIIGDANGRVCAVETKGDRRIECQLVGLTAGVSPNLDLVAGGPIRTGRGVLVDAALRTNVPGIFAAGDCAEIVKPEGERNLIQQVWYTGKMQGRTAGESMAGRTDPYDPGIWYNSAKFLDLEYQTYGRVNMGVANERTLYWEHAEGKRALRLCFTDAAGVHGINVMGMRYRHEVCERWIRERRPIDHVLEHLADADFDPELFRRHTLEIQATLGGRKR